jgi:iron(III) transport system permease protein
MTLSLAPAPSPPPETGWARPRRGGQRPTGPRRRLIVVVGTVVAAVLLAPLVLVLLDARSAGWTEIHRVLFRERSLMLLRHTVTLGVLVAALSATLGVSAAWATERTALPLRRLWTVLLVLPIAMPDFVVGWAWHSIDPRISPLGGATLVMTLGTYPLVYLPVAAALRRTDPALEDTAHGLGVGRLRTFWRISLPQIAPAVLGGTVLVTLTVISEYGTFEILRYPTFTTEVFNEFQFAPQAAGALSIPLVLLGLLALGTEGLLSRRRGSRHVGVVRLALPASRWRPRIAPTVAALAALVTLGVGVPIGTLFYWIAQSQHTSLPPVATLGHATLTTIGYSAWGAGLAVLAAAPVALMSFRRQTRVRSVLERSTFVTQALPGVVVALSLVYFVTHYAFGLYQTGTLLVIAYAVIHFPLALVCVKASTAQAPARLADVGASLGRGPVSVFLRVVLPLMAPGLLAGFCLVFLTAITELTATLVLAPIGVETLATQFWAFQSEVANGAAAPYALVIIGLAVVPGALLGLWFDRGTRQAEPLPDTP